MMSMIRWAVTLKRGELVNYVLDQLSDEELIDLVLKVCVRSNSELLSNVYDILVERLREKEGIIAE